MLLSKAKTISNFKNVFLTSAHRFDKILLNVHRRDLCTNTDRWMKYKKGIVIQSYRQGKKE